MAKTKKEIKYTANQIVDMHDKKRSSTPFTDLFDQMEGDFDLFALKPYVAEIGHQSYTSPKPLNDFTKVLTGINKASLTWQIAVPEDAPENDRDAASKGEEILTGVLTQADENLSSNGEPPLRMSSGWLGCNRGAVGIKCLIYNDDNKEVVIDIQSFDPLHMAWEKGYKGLNWASFEYMVSKVEAEERWNVTIKEEEARVIDFFTRKINAIVIVEGSAEDGRQFVKDPTPHGLDHVPVWIEFAGGMPTVFNRCYEQKLKQRANSVFAASRNIYTPMNKQVSFIMDTSEKSVAGTLVYETENGVKGIEGDPFANWKVIKTKTGEILKALEPPKVPPESAAILSILDRDMQQSTVPFPAGYGLDPGTHSGSALSMLNDNTRSIYDPFTSLLERAYKWLCKEILIQFKAKGQKITLKGFNQDGKFYTLDASPDDIQDNWYINVKCEPKLPRDEAGELQMALQATQTRKDGTPLISDFTAREKIIKLQNPDAEQARIDEQILKRQIESIPEYKLRKMALAMLKAGDKDGVQLFLSKLAELQAKQNPAGQNVQPGQNSATMPSGQTPPGQAVSGSNGQQLSPQEIAKLQAIAQQYEKAGQPVPQDIQLALSQIKE